MIIQENILDHIYWCFQNQLCVVFANQCADEDNSVWILCTPSNSNIRHTHAYSIQCLYFAIYKQPEAHLGVCTALHWQSLRRTCAEPRHSWSRRRRSGAATRGASGSSPDHWQSTAAVPPLDPTRSTCMGGKQRVKEVLGQRERNRRSTMNDISIFALYERVNERGLWMRVEAGREKAERL